MLAKLRKQQLKAFYICNLSIFTFLDFTHISFLLLLLVFSSFFIRLYFYLTYFVPFAFSFIPKSKPGSGEAVSVIIAARNEAENVLKFLPKILSQNYHEYEVIVVDDHSTDRTWEFLQEMNSKYSNLSVFQSDKDSKGKKAAILLGISKARHAVLLFTDADCYPATENWIKEIMNSKMEKSIVLGYGRYEKQKGFLNSLVRYDTFYTGLRYLSFAKAGNPYMGVGRNLLYTKKVFESSTAFWKHAEVASGDDDLLINEMSNKENTNISVSYASHTISIPNESLKGFFFQKLRHLGVGRFYGITDKVRLAMESFSRAIFLTGSFVLLLMNEWTVLPFVLLMVVLQQVVLWKATAKLEDKDLRATAIFLEPIHFVFLFVCGIGSLFNKNVKWK